MGSLVVFLRISRTDQIQEFELFRSCVAYVGPVKQIICRFMGHRDYSPDILEHQPWRRYPDFSGYGLSDFRELNCLRCGEPLPAAEA
jgi:hypothetical protein